MRLSILIKTVVILSLGIFFLPSACAKKQPAAGEGAGKNHAPVMKSVQIEPQTDNLKAQAVAEDPEGDQVSFAYQWLLNGTDISGQTREEFSPQGLSPEDKIAVRVTPSDGKAEGQPLVSDSFQAHNTLPLITSVKIVPVGDKILDPLRAEVEATDADHDPITLSYQWLKNREEIPGATAQVLESSFFEKGKILQVRVTPSDRYGQGKPVVSSNSIRVVNVPPSITSDPPVTLDNGVFRYQVIAADPDNQELTYSLNAAPPGMQISPGGLVEWTPPPGQSGVVTVDVRVADPDGGSANQKFSLNIQGSK
ncbi:MAG: Ig-like domain-containing protein [bacterium]|nr:Ig-like domain-containing protein [bacterium]